MLATASSKISFGLKPNNKKTSVVYRALLKRYHDLNKGNLCIIISVDFINLEAKGCDTALGTVKYLLEGWRQGGQYVKFIPLGKGVACKFLFAKQRLWPEG